MQMLHLRKRNWKSCKWAFSDFAKKLQTFQSESRPAFEDIVSSVCFEHFSEMEELSNARFFLCFAECTFSVSRFGEIPFQRVY